MPGRPAAAAASSASRMRAPMAWKSGRSPFTRIARWRSARSVPPPTMPRGDCGLRKLISPASGSGLIARILAPRRLAVSRAASIRGWLVPGFWPATTISEAAWMSSSETEPLPIPITSARATEVELVAHVGAVGEVVRAEGAGEQPVGERRLVGGAPGGVEDRLIGAREPAEVRADQPERLVPADLLVAVGARPAHHRVRQAALLAEPVVAALLELGEGMAGEELRADAPQRGLLGDRLGAVLAELGGVAMAGVGVGPGAALAVEAVGLVHAPQRLRGPGHAHLADGVGEGGAHRPQPGGRAPGLRDADRALVDVALGGRGAHGPILSGWV